MRLTALTCALALLLGLPAVASAAAAPSARAFVAWIYGHYPIPETSHFEPMGRSAPQVWDAGMVALLKEDSRLAGGEVGFIDADEFCQCQDDGGMKSRIADVQSTGPASAVAHVTLSYPGEAGGAPQTVTLYLVLVKGQWRVHDLGNHDNPSLRADLIKANAEARRGHH